MKNANSVANRRIEKIILITLDSVRADRLSILGYHKKTTPNLEYLCKSVNCLTITAYANAPYTKAAFKSIMTGLLPFSVKTYYSIEGLPTIASYLKKDKYRTLAIPNSDLLSSRYGYDKGFDVFLNTSNSNYKDLKSMTSLLRKIVAPRYTKNLSRRRYCRCLGSDP
jgi:arylsulfatase A-like enzyme